MSNILNNNSQLFATHSLIYSTISPYKHSVRILYIHESISSWKYVRLNAHVCTCTYQNDMVWSRPSLEGDRVRSSIYPYRHSWLGLNFMVCLIIRRHWESRDGFFRLGFHEMISQKICMVYDFELLRAEGRTIKPHSRTCMFLYNWGNLVLKITLTKSIDFTTIVFALTRLNNKYL